MRRSGERREPVVLDAGVGPHQLRHPASTGDSATAFTRLVLSNSLSSSTPSAGTIRHRLLAGLLQEVPGRRVPPVEDPAVEPVAVGNGAVPQVRERPSQWSACALLEGRGAASAFRALVGVLRPPP